MGGGGRAGRQWTPRPPPAPASGANFMSKPSEWLSAAWRTGCRCPRVHIVKDVKGVEGKNAAVGTGDQGAATGPGLEGRGLSSLCSPPPGLGHRTPGTLACLGVLPAESPRGQDPAGRAEGSSGPPAGFGEPVRSAGGGGSLARGPLPPSVSPALLSPGLGGRREEDLDGDQILHFLLQLPGETLEAAERRPAGREVDGRTDRRTRGGAGGGSTIGRPNQASRQTDEGNNIITPRTPWGRYSKYLIK